MLALKAGKQAVSRFAFSADGRYLAVAGSEYRVRLWDLFAPKPKAKPLPPFESRVNWIGFRPDGRLVALSLMGQHQLHDPAAGTTASGALRRWWVGDIAAEPDGSAFYGTGWQARKWALDGRLREVWDEPVPGERIAGRGGAVLTPDGALVAAVSNGGDRTWLHTRDAATGAFRGEQLVARSIVRDLTLLPGGRGFVFVRERQYKGKAANALVAGAPGGAFEAVRKPKRGAPEFTALALHPSGAWAAVGVADGTVRVLDTATWTEARAYQWPVGPVAGLAFSPDGLRAAAGGADGQFVVWDVDM